MKTRGYPILLLAATAIAQTTGSQVPSTNGQTAAITGRVINAVTGEPVRKAAVTLRPADRMGGPGGSGRPGGQAPNSAGPASRAGSATSSDADGRFRFDNLQPGSYMLVGEKAGFVRQAYTTRRVSTGPFSGTPLAVSGGQDLSGIEFKLTPQGVILGRVTDEEGEPMPRASLLALRVGAASQQGAVGTASTNDVGEFRLSNLPAGRYHILVQNAGRMGPGPMAGRGGARFGGPGQAAQAAESYMPTYYPGVIEAGQAAAIEVAAGQEVAGMNIQLRKSQVYRIRGRVSGLDAPAEGQRQQARLLLQPAGGAPFGRLGMSGAQIRPDGSFEVANVAPGSYDLVLMQFGRGGGGAIGRTPVSVGRGDVDDVAVQVMGLVDVIGVVRMDGDPKYQATGTLRFLSAGGGGRAGGGPGFGPMSGNGGTPNGRISEGSAFTYAGLGRDRFIPQMQPLPVGAYIKEVRVSNQTVADLTIDLTRSPSTVPVEVILSAKGAAIDGSVLDGDKPVDSAGIVAVPEGAGESTLSVRGKTAVSNSDGKFTMEGLAPGDYKLYVLEEPVNLQTLELEALRAYEAAAIPVRLRESGRESVSLKIDRLK